MFDGSTLSGWHAVPRLPVPPWPGGPEPDRESLEYRRAAATSGRWTVDDGAIIGAQDPSGFGQGGYLVSNDVYADFHLTFEVRPDWPADTGVMLRATPLGSQGFQVLIDHRKSGGIAGFYGNGIGSFHALAHNIDIERDEAGHPVRLVEEDPQTTLEPVSAQKRALLRRAAPAEAFLGAWRWGDWNEISVRCVGKYPVLTTWVNGIEINELDTATIRWPSYDRDAVAALLGRAGHIALEVHDNDPGMGSNRWAPESKVRWRRLRLERLGAGE